MRLRKLPKPPLAKPAKTNHFAKIHQNSYQKATPVTGLLFTPKSSETIDFLSHLCYNEDVAQKLQNCTLKEGIQMYMYDISCWLATLALFFLFNTIITLYCKRIKSGGKEAILKTVIAGLLITIAKIIDYCLPELKPVLNDSQLLAYIIIAIIIALFIDVCINIKKIYNLQHRRQHRRQRHTQPRRAR